MVLLVMDRMCEIRGGVFGCYSLNIFDDEERANRHSQAAPGAFIGLQYS